VRGDHDAAEAMYQRALEADPSHANNLGNCASFLTDVRGDHDAAEAMYQRALEADPSHTNNLGGYANFLTDVRGDHDAAEAMYQRALEADPSHANNVGNYARLLFVCSRDDEGEKLVGQALEFATSASDLPLRAECEFYSFMHVAARRMESGTTLKALLAQGVATGAWNFSQNLARIAREEDRRHEMLTAVAEALRVGNVEGLDRFEEWREIGTP